MANTKACDECGAIAELSACARCHTVAFCSRRCQKRNWKNGHKEVCTPPPDCPICLEPLYPDQSIKTLACNHSFHWACSMYKMDPKQTGELAGYTVLDITKPSFANLCPLCRGWDGFAIENDRPWWKGTPEMICMEVLSWCFQAEEVARNGCDTDNVEQEREFVLERIEACKGMGQYEAVLECLEASTAPFKLAEGRADKPEYLDEVQSAKVQEMWYMATVMLFNEMFDKYKTYLMKYTKKFTHAR